jgi:signal transduction histidine kinase
LTRDRAPVPTAICVPARMTAVPYEAEDVGMRSGRAAAAAVAALGVAAFVVLCVADGADRPPGWALALIALAAAIPVVLGLVLAWRRPGLMVGALLAAFSTVPLAEFAVHAWGATEATAHPWPGAHWAAVIDVSGWMWFFLPPVVLAAVFPGGRVLSRRGRWLLFGWPVVLAAFAFGVALDPSTYQEGGGTVPGRAPAWAPEAVGTAVGLLALAGFAALLVGSAAAILARYRHGDTRLRRQIRWLTLSAFLLPLALLTTWFCYLLGKRSAAEAIVVAGLLVAYLGMPVGTAVAVLRHDLYDIDRLLSRTVSYTVLTAALFVVFATVAFTAGLVLGRGSAPAVALATLCCAAVFARIRQRVQAVVDRRFDRARGRAVAEVAGFVDAVRDGRVAPEQIESALRTAVVDPDLRVAYALPNAEGGVFWLDGAGDRVPAPAEPSREIRSGGRTLAVVEFGQRTAARPAMLAAVLREAHLPLELARSRIEVRSALAETEASRARLVRAGYEERRRLERDLHDGAQQRLVAVGLSLRLAQRHLAPGEAYAMLGDAVLALQEAVAELRRISHGVRPSGLDDGLPAALRTLVRASPVPVELRVTTDRVQDAVATTAYYVAAEAVANALKHADSRRLLIEVSRDGGTLSVSVSDDGCGGASIVPGRGLGGLADRVSASGGTLHILSEPGTGTTVKALLPCAS